MANTNRFQLAVDLTTLDANAKTAVSIPVPANSTALFSGTVVAREEGGVSKAWVGSALVKNVSGTVSEVGGGQPFTPIGDTGTTAWAATIGFTGTNYTVTVTGAAATVINWSIQGDIVIVMD